MTTNTTQSETGIRQGITEQMDFPAMPRSNFTIRGDVPGDSRLTISDKNGGFVAKVLSKLLNHMRDRSQ